MWHMKRMHDVSYSIPFVSVGHLSCICSVLIHVSSKWLCSNHLNNDKHDCHSGNNTQSC